jgi:outer membrane protein OmpA-like peptidoglycan-associated protein
VVHSVSFGITRNDAISYFDALISTWDSVSTEVWINENSSDPGVLVGDNLVYTMVADQPAYYVLVSIDSKGSTSVLKPTALEKTYAPSRKYVFPPLPDGCSFPISEECRRETNAVVQAEPLGKETVFVIASDLEIPNSVLGIPQYADFRSLGANEEDIEELIQRLKVYFKASGSVYSIGQYQYTVDGDLQISTADISEMLDTRSIKQREVGPDSGNSTNDEFYISQDIIDRNKELAVDDTQLNDAIVTEPVVAAEPAVATEPVVTPEPAVTTEIIVSSVDTAEQAGSDEEQPVTSSVPVDPVDSRPEEVEPVPPVNLRPLPDGRIIASSQPSPATVRAQVIGTPIVANDISFEPGSSQLNKRGRNQLDVIGSELLDRISKQDFPVLALVGHTDSSGSEERNMQLSRERAESAKNYLVGDWGLPQERILTSGKGELRPLVSNDSEQNRARNRRVEILVLN